MELINLKVFTAQYRYSGTDRFDITAKGRVHLEFAPTFEMVMKHKNEEYSNEQYIDLYMKRMRWSYKKYPEAWKNLLNKNEVTLVCFCASGGFCHRYILKDILVKLGAEYCGERIIPKKATKNS